MPITPRFSVEQTSDEVLVKIHVPYVRVSQAEIVASRHDFTFFCKPYFLKLTLPHEVVEDDRCRAVYDPDNDHGLITAHLPKLVPGQHFPDLDMVSKLLQNRIAKDNKDLCPPLIEVVGEVMHESSNDVVLEEQSGSIIDDSRCNVDMLLAARYGFNNLYSKVLGNLRDELIGVVSLPLPDSCAMKDRRAARIAAEDEMFSADRYLADKLHAEEDYIYVEAMRHCAHWDASWESWKPSGSDGESAEAHVEFSDANNATMTNLPRRASLYHVASLSPLQEKQIMFTLIDILCAYCYDCRITQSDPTVESATNISLLSASLSWLEVYTDEDDVLSVLITSARRIMCNGYLRVWKLIRKVFVDVTKILLLGKRCVLKCLLDLHHIIEHTDTHYILNKLFTNDYCIWLQTADLGDVLQRYGNIMNATKKHMEIDLLGFPLKDLEKRILEEESLKESDSSSDSESSEESSSDSEESDENEAAVATDETATDHSVPSVVQRLVQLDIGAKDQNEENQRIPDRKVLIEEIN